MPKAPSISARSPATTASSTAPSARSSSRSQGLRRRPGDDTAVMHYASKTIKCLEGEWLEKFRWGSADFPEGTIEQGETPDAIIRSGGYRTGIEITRVYIDKATKRDSLQSRETGMNNITRDAEQIFNERNSISIYVDLHFNRNWKPNKRRDREIARSVAETVLAQAARLPDGESRWVHYTLHSGHPIEVDLIWISRISDFGTNRWNWREAGEPVNDVRHLIQAAIDNKQERLAACLQKCDECWLLVVAPSCTPAGMVHADESSLVHTYICNFQRTYLLNDSFNAASTLNTVRSLSRRP
jgi:hypothetical protein